MPRVAIEPLPFKEQVERFRALGLEPSSSYEDTLAAARNDAFAVTGITQLDMLADIKEALAEAMEQGLGFDEFQERVEDIFDEYGWGFDGNRLKVIYDTNLNAAFNAARDEQIALVAQERLDDSGEDTYCRFSTVGDERVCDECQDYAGIVALWDDPIWDQVSLPIHPHDRCIKESLSESEALDAGWDIDEEEEAA